VYGVGAAPAGTCFILAGDSDLQCRDAVLGQSGRGGRSNLVSSGDASELVSGPDAKDGAHAEVGIHNRGAVQGVESHGEALA